MKRNLLIILIAVLSGCEEQIYWDLQSQELQILVVDGLITNEKRSHKVTLTWSVSELNRMPDPVTDAFVAISDGDTVYILTEYPVASGRYYTDSTVQGVVGKAYYLYIKTGNSEFMSIGAEMVPVGPMDLLAYRQTPENENLYEFIYLESSEPSMMQIYLDWSHLVPAGQQEEARAWIRYYTLKSIDVNELFKPDDERVVFPVGTIVYKRKLSLSAGHQSFLRSLMMETEWKGGVFDVLPANVITNMQGGALGFFAAASVVADTLIFLPGP